MQNNMGNWIKTKNRLPEDDRTVIATNDNGLVRMANYDHDTHAWKTGHRILNEKIIAWQYVPDTPSALWENDMPESEHRVNVQHTVRGKKTIVDEEAICKYEDITGETFTDETAELMLCRGLMTDKNLELTNDMMSNILQCILQ